MAKADLLHSVLTSAELVMAVPSAGAVVADCLVCAQLPGHGLQRALCLHSRAPQMHTSAAFIDCRVSVRDSEVTR